MKRVYLLKGLTCPNCSAKIEKDVGELNRVHASSINLMKQTLTIESDASAEFLLVEISEIVHSHEPDVEVFELNSDKQKSNSGTESDSDCWILILRLVIGAVICGIGLASAVVLKAPLYIELAFLIVSYLILGGDVVWRALVNILRGRIFDEHFLMSVSTIGAFVIGEYPEAVAVMLFYHGGYEKATARPLFEFRKRKKAAFYWDQRKRGLSRMPFINIPQSRYIAVLDIPGYAFLPSEQPEPRRRRACSFRCPSEPTRSS